MPQLPSGTVTFAFSDIEGSTQLLRQLHDEGYGTLLATHRRLVREISATHGGQEIDTQGDALFFSFARARGAVAAAVAIQRAHAEETWPQGVTVRIRLGLHTGEPTVGDEGYTRLDVVRAARIAALGHGGHVLLSETTRAIVAGDLPEGVEVRPLGERQLKDLDRPEPVYELVIRDVPATRAVRQSASELARRSAAGRIMRVIVAEDVLLTRRGIVTVLREAGVDVVDEVADAEGLIASTERHRPDAVVTDIRMPPTGTREGLEAALRIRQSNPQIGVLVLSQFLEPAYAVELISEHPSGMGYLLKERVYDAALVVDALRRLTEGETVVDPTIVSRLFGRRRGQDPLEDLTEREREVLALVAEGMSNRAISARLSITERTVEAHVTQIFQKLMLEESPDSHRRVLAVLAFLRT